MALEEHKQAAPLLGENIDPGVRIDPAKVATNIVVFDVSESPLPPAEIGARLKQRGVLLNAINQRQMRAVTHYDAGREACSRALVMVAEAMAS